MDGSPSPANLAALARRWLKLEPGRTLCGVNELGVWWNDEQGSTHLVGWQAVLTDLDT